MSARRRRAVVAAGIVLGVVVAAGVAGLVATSGNSAPALKPPSVAPAVASPFPAPPPGAVVFAREDRSDVLALAAVPQAWDLAPDIGGRAAGTGVRGLRVSLAAGGRSATRASACGAGCYQAVLTLRSQPRFVRVVVQRPSRTTIWDVRLPVPWPARGAAALVARAGRVWSQLRSLSYLDRLSSDPVHTVVSHWRIVAPDRLAYEIEQSGDQTVIIGRRRWDRSGDGGWVKSSAIPLHQPRPFWVAATDAHIVGSGRIGNRPVWRVSFFDPKTPAWFLISIDKRTARTLDMRMRATAHFMHDTYGQFNAPLKVIPPT